jgi:hypothetical protein
MGATAEEERARQAALKYLASTHPEYPKSHVQSIQRRGSQYLVTLMPENRMGILLFFMTFKVWVNATTGVVEKIT